jgi:hypothetical protein
MTHTALRVETNRAALQGRSRQRSFHSPLTGARAWTFALDQIVAPADTNRPRGHRARSGSAGMTATARRIRSLVTARTTAARCADMLDTRGRARSRSQVALFCLRERDRLLRAGRRARPLRTAAHLAAQRADARGRPGRHARPLPAHRRHSPARALTTQPQAPAAGAGRAGHTRSVIQAAVTQPAADTPTLSLLAAGIRLVAIAHVRRPGGQAASRSPRLPSPHRLGSARPPGRHSVLCQPPDPHKEGTKDERHSPRR